MKIKQITETSTTAGSIAPVQGVLGSTQTRGNPSIYGGKKVGNLFKGKTTSKPYANSLNEAAMKDLSYDLEVMKPAEFQKKYGKSREEVKAALSRQPKPAQPTTPPINEADLSEHDLIMVPGQGKKLKPGFISKADDRTDHEVEMARSDLFQSAKNAKKVYSMIKDVGEDEGLEGWVQEKIIKANDYLNTVREYLEGKQTQGVAEGGSVTHKGGEVSRKDGVTKHKAGPGVYGGYDASRHPDSPEEKHAGPRGAKAGHSSDKITKHQSVAEGLSNDMSTEDMIAYLRQHHDKNLHQDYLNHLTSTNSKFVLKNIPINSIRTELSGLDRAKVEQYKKMDFSKAPPIVVGSDGNILDGYHRATVAKALGIPTIKAYVGVKGQQGVAEGSGGNWYIRVNGKILNDTKFKPVIFSSEDEARSHAMKLADKKRIPLSQIKLTKSWMDAPEQGVAEGSLEEYGDTKKGQKILTKVHKRAVGRAIKAADQGDAQAAKKNQDTANRAWERFGPSFGEGVAEGKESPEKEIERLKLRQDAEHGHAPLRRQAATQARIRELEKQIKGKQGVAEGEYDSRKPFGVRYKVFAGREGRVTTKEYWTTSEEKLQKAVDKIQALDNFYEIDGYSYPKESQGVTEVFADQGSGSTDRDNAEYMKRRKAAKFNKSAKPSKPKNQQEYDAIEKYRKDLAQTYNKPKKEQGVAEAKNLKKRVKIVKGPDAGKTGWIREIKHGAFKGAPKSYYLDLDDGGQANNLPGAALRLIKDQSLSENAEDLHVGDPVIITGNGIKFEGATGEIVDFGRDNRFVVVNLYNHGRHSFHSSDVSFNEYAGSDDEEARMYDAGEFGDDYRDEMDEARTSAAQRLSNAWDRQRAKSNASLARTPSSIPKKEEPKKADPVPKTVSEHRTQRRALMAQMLNSH